MLYELCRAAVLALAFTGIAIAAGCHPDFADPADAVGVRKAPAPAVTEHVAAPPAALRLTPPFDTTPITPMESVGAGD